MKSFISEDSIEKAICDRLSLREYGWERIECDPSPDAMDEVAKTGRANSSECVLPGIFLSSLKRINPPIGENLLKDVVRDFLRSNKPMVFTLIHKFQYDKTRKYPVLSDRDDIFVLVDEAHRTERTSKTVSRF